MISLLYQAPVKDWIRFFFVANEVRGFSTLADLAPQLMHQYRDGYENAAFIIHHWAFTVHYLLRGLGHG